MEVADTQPLSGVCGMITLSSQQQKKKFPLPALPARPGNGERPGAGFQQLQEAGVRHPGQLRPRRVRLRSSGRSRGACHHAGPRQKLGGEAFGPGARGPSRSTGLRSRARPSGEVCSQQPRAGGAARPARPPHFPFPRLPRLPPPLSRKRHVGPGAVPTPSPPRTPRAPGPSPWRWPSGSGSLLAG